MNAENKGGVDGKKALIQRLGPMIVRDPRAPFHRLIGRRRHRFITTLLELDRQHRLCHLGCGDGETLSRLEAEVKVGVERSAHHLEAAGKRLGSGVELVQAPFDALPFPDAYFDRILLTCELEEITEADRIFLEIRRVLAYNGLLVVAVSREGLLDDARGLFDRLRLLGVLGAGRWGSRLWPARLRNRWLDRTFSAEKLEEMIKGSFRIRRVLGIPFVPPYLVLIARLVRS
ncbi:MAG: class I SAM-dependent methyltransferase [Bradymonadales bacterium]|nr:class I SAM-dependent methyltransferase [Bradymonadales bacterium]